MDNSISTKHYHYGLVVTVTLLMITGITAIYAASSMKAIQQFNDPYFFLRKQSSIAVVCLFSIGFSRFVSKAILKRLALPFMIISLLSLVAIYIPGAYHKVGGASRWIDLGFIKYQTSEFAKIAIIFLMAKNLSRPSHFIEKFSSGILPTVLLLSLFSWFLMLQPDFGTTALIIAVAFSMLVISGLPKRYIIASGSMIILLAAIAIVIAPYRMRRILAFLDPWSQIKEGGFQIIQSYLAFQNGGLFGTGLGESKQKLFFLPEAHTDFILSVVGEELGFVGTAAIIVLFASLVFVCFRITKKQTEPYYFYLGFGFTLLIAYQTLFNIGVVLGLLPTKGIPLPFISNGSSSLLTFSAIICIFMILNRQEKDHEET